MIAAGVTLKQLGLVSLVKRYRSFACRGLGRRDYS
jgi:hypothetical protein